MWNPKIVIMDLRGKVLVVREGCRRDPCEKRPRAALCWTQLFPAGSARDLPEDTAEPISQAGGTSGKASVRKSKALYSSKV